MVPSSSSLSLRLGRYAFAVSCSAFALAALAPTSEAAPAAAASSAARPSASVAASASPRALASVSASASPSASASNRPVADVAPSFVPASPVAGAGVAAPAVRAIGLPDAIAYARTHQPLIAAAKARIAAAQANARIPDGQWAPQLGVSAQIFGATSNNSTASYLGDPAIDIPRIGGSGSVYRWSDTTFRPYASTFVGVGVGQEVYDFGRIAAQRVALESFVDVERYRSAADELDVYLAVRESYFAVQTAHSIVDSAGAAYDRAKAHHALADAQVRSKLWAPIEVTRAEAELTRADVARLRAAGALAIARSVLAAAVGTDERAIDAAGELPEAAGLPPLDQAIAEASGRDPVIRQALAMVTAQEAGTKAIGAELRPNLFLSATLSARAGGAPTSNGAQPSGYGLVPSVPNWDVGVVFSWPITDGVVDARKEASRAKEDALRAEVDLRKAQQVASIERAYYAAQIALASLPALARALEAARANYAQADARFKAGLGSSVEVADAESVLAESEIRLAMGKFEAARARAVFGRAIAEDAK
jgi:outer membrane protein TolC